jgi:hypothetical protein
VTTNKEETPPQATLGRPNISFLFDKDGVVIHCERLEDANLDVVVTSLHSIITGKLTNDIIHCIAKYGMLNGQDLLCSFIANKIIDRLDKPAVPPSKVLNQMMNQ